MKIHLYNKSAKSIALQTDSGLKVYKSGFKGFIKDACDLSEDQISVFKSNKVYIGDKPKPEKNPENNKQQ